MLEEVLVVSIREVVRPRVRAAALLAGESRNDHAVRQLKQELELERLRQVVVEDLALVVDDDVLVALAQRLDDLSLFFHLILAPEDAEVLVHRPGKLLADAPRALAVRTVEQLLQVTLCVGLR